jgi:hypothetical protein
MGEFPAGNRGTGPVDIFRWASPFVVLVARFGCLVHKIALYLSMKAGKTDLSKKKKVNPG